MPVVSQQVWCKRSNVRVTWGQRYIWRPGIVLYTLGQVAFWVYFSKVSYIYTHTHMFIWQSRLPEMEKLPSCWPPERLTDKKEIDRITNKLMNKIIIPTETMDTVATMTSKQIKSKCNTEIHEHIRQNTALKYSVTHNSNNTDQINTC